MPPGSGSAAEALARGPAWRAAEAIRAGELTSETLVRACLERIEAREASVQAFDWLDPAAALREACARDAAPARGLLHGIPYGVKDIIDTADAPTAYGSPIYAGHRPRADAACVSLLRAAGAVALGKTATTEFAALHPTRTRNPLDLERTPGGSSSGSAAAVADGMLPAALGTQTAGSVIRPASFCGIVGYKPTFGLFNLAGVKHFAESLDTLGVLARSVRDVDLFRCALTERTPIAANGRRPARAVLCRTARWDAADPATHAAVEGAVADVRSRGIEVAELELPDRFATLFEDLRMLMAYEAVRAFAWERERHGTELSATLHEILDTGDVLSAEDYDAARERTERRRVELDPILADVDLVIAPAAVGEAPTGLDRTGDPLFNGIWTALHVPCLTLPRFRGTGGLPVGIQLVAARGRDAALLAHARWLEREWGRE